MVLKMLNDKRTDEDLVEACRLGDVSAPKILVKRYEQPLRYFLLPFSWIKDASFIDDIIQLTFLTIFKGIKEGKFDPSKGLFKRWAYGICQKICLAENRNHRRRPKPISERYPEEFPDDLVKVRPEPTPDPEVFNRRRAQLARALEMLIPPERRLFELRRQGLSYQRIKNLPDFQKFSLGRLRLKYYEIMETLRTILRKEDK